MKKSITNKVKLIILSFIIGLVFTALFTEKSVSVCAEEETNNEKNLQQDSADETTNQNLSLTGNYKYSNTINPKFIIKDVKGTISISEEVIIRFIDKTVVVPNFNFYRIVDKNNDIRFYQADTITDNPDYSAFVYIGILPPSMELNTDYYVMYLQYGVAETTTLYNVKIVLSELEFYYFDAIAQPLVLGNDDLSQRLKASIKASKYGVYEEEVDEKELAIEPMAMNSIRHNAYDSYTNSDGIIHSYVENYFGTHIQNGIITDDPIVQIIPKDLCFILGEHFYIGKEYGFFIKVMTDDTVQEDYEVDIFVFDIQNTIPSFPSNTTGSTKVVPLFQYKYRAMDRYRKEDWVGDWIDYDQNLTRIVFRHYAYDAAEYFLNDVYFRHTISNPTILNPGDDGYDPYKDDGAFIIQMRYNSCGVGIKRKGGSFVLDTILFACGFGGKSRIVNVISYLDNVLSYVDNVYQGFGSDKNYFYTREATVKDNEANIDTYETNNTDQISVRGNLIKSMTTTPLDDSEEPKLIHVGGGYAESKYVVARRSGSNYNKIHAVTSISASILEDNTSRYWLFGWREQGETIDYGRANGTYQVSNYQRVEDVNFSGEANIYIPAESGHKIAKFVPSVSGNYRFETISADGDPNFYVIDATTNETKSAIDDLDGSNDRNARLDMYLNAGHIYYIDAFSYNSSYAYRLHISNLLESSITLTHDMNNSCSVDKGTYKLYKFVPDTTGSMIFLRKKN